MCGNKKPTFTIDVQHYQKYLDNSDISDDDKQELLETLWEIVCEVVSLGFGVHPLQDLESECGKSLEKNEDSTLLSSDMVKLFYSTLSENFNETAQAESVLEDKEAEDDNTE